MDFINKVPFVAVDAFNISCQVMQSVVFSSWNSV